jgi:cell division septum initiation protein DivIVA
MTEANDKANDITAAARLEARRVVGKAKHEIEETKRELSTLYMEKRRFLRESNEFAAAFAHLIEEAGRKMEKGNPSLDEVMETPAKQETGRMTLSFTAVADDADEIAIS